jgi:hypothetical protein
METGGTSVVLLMVRDAYANYVVQTALDVVPEGEEKRLLMEELTSHSAQLVSTTILCNICFIETTYSCSVSNLCNYFCLAQLHIRKTHCNKARGLNGSNETLKRWTPLVYFSKSDLRVTLYMYISFVVCRPIASH